MCPSALLLDFDVGSTDEKPVLFLGQRRAGDPIPSNVIVENPFSMEPWDAHQDRWYLYNPDDSESQKGEDGIKATGKGYWKLMGHDLRIMTSTTTVGRKTMRKFFTGQAPFGGRTDWMMHEYQADPKVSQEFNNAQEYSSLCRVFQQSNQNTNHEEQLNPVASDDVGGEYVEHMILQALDEEEEENNFLLQDATNNFEEVGREQHRALAASDRSSQHLVSSDSAESMQAKSDFSKEDYIEVNDLCSLETSSTSGRSSRHLVSSDSAESMQAMSDFSKEDYMELNDLCSLETSSSSSDNSSLMSRNSDEYFDVNELLSDLQNENSRNVGQRHVDCRRSITASAESSQVVIRPPLQASVNSNINNSLVVEESAPSTSVGGNGFVSVPIRSSSIQEQASITSTYQGNQTNRTLSGSSQGSSSSQGSGSRSVARIAKLGKRYCCFGSF